MAIDRNKILPGDLLIFRIVKQSHLLGKLIGFFSVLMGKEGEWNFTYGHVAICEDKNSYLEMTWPVSKRTSIDDAVKNPETEIWRIEDMTPDRAKIVLKWAQDNLGVHYNIRHIISLGFLQGYGCGDFLAKALRNCRIELTFEGRNDPVVSPNEVACSKETVCVDNNGHDVPNYYMLKG